MITDLTNTFTTTSQHFWKSMSDKLTVALGDYEAARYLHMHTLIESLDPHNQITDHIWIGGEDSAYNPDLLKSVGIKNVLNMAIECSCFPDDGLNITKIGIHDGRLAPDGVYAKAADVIGESVSRDEKIYVHCAAGISRSTTAVVAYLMINLDMGFVEALSLVKSKRPAASPHPLLVRTLVRDMDIKFIF